MIKIGIIGCGKVADQHAEQIKYISNCDLVAACDKEILMAKQLHERFKIPLYFDDVEEFLETVHPDVVHITTTPQSHFELGEKCLRAGCNVFIEKPFTINFSEAEALINLANDKNLKLTAGHNYQFTHAALRMRELIKKGFLGGDPIHMESYYCYNLGGEAYAKALLGDKNHWVRELPGKLLHNIINHGICKIAEFLNDDSPKVIAQGFTSSVLKSIHEDDIIDELRVTIVDKNNTTAYFTFSTQLKPTLHQFRIYGQQNSIIIDSNHQTIIKVRGNKFKSYLDYFVPPFIYAKQYLGNTIFNLIKFAQRDFQMEFGMRTLFEAFYRSVAEDAPLPISYKEILLTTKIMDSIFDQVMPN